MTGKTKKWYSQAKKGDCVQRIILLGLVILFVFTSTSSAKIARGTDSFTGYAAIKSYTYDEKAAITRIDLAKLFDPNLPEYKIYILNQGHEKVRDFILGNSPMEMRVDDNSVYKLNNENYGLKPIDGGYGTVISDLTIKVPLDAIEEIKKAKRVALRITMENGDRQVYVLPDPVLTEWQQVINTEK